MMADTSYAIIVGRLTKDPEEVQAKGGVMATFSLASNHVIAGVKTASFFDVAAFGKIAESILKNDAYRKGLRVLVRGNLRQRRWEAKDGTKRSSYTVWLDSMPDFLEYRPKDEIGTFADAAFADPDLTAIPF